MSSRKQEVTQFQFTMCKADFGFTKNRLWDKYGSGEAR